jgi:hypothetical protein
MVLSGWILSGNDCQFRADPWPVSTTRWIWDMTDGDVVAIRNTEGADA